jgi:mRNA interferase RelE/StbE
MTDRVGKFLSSLDKKTKSRLKKKLEELKFNPLQCSGVKKLKGTKNTLYRLRVGKIRIIYAILESGIEIVDIDYRGDIYK